MVKVEGLLWGIYPKSENLRIRIGRWERGALSTGELDSLIRQETEEYQEIAKGAMHTDPLFNWYDVFRTISLVSNNIELGPLTRFEETNTFYRIPHIIGVPSLKLDPSGSDDLKENPPLPMFHSTSHWTAFLPGISTLYDYSSKANVVTKEGFSSGMVKIYGNIIEKFHPDYTLIMEREPVDETELRALAKITDPGKLILFTAGSLQESAFRAANVKFKSIVTSTEGSDVEIAARHSFIPGIKLIDGRNTRMEALDGIKTTVEKIASDFDLDRVLVANSEYLDFLPRKIADRKADLLSRLGD